jgi:hypothetical protein
MIAPRLETASGAAVRLNPKAERTDRCFVRVRTVAPRRPALERALGDHNRLIWGRFGPSIGAHGTNSPCWRGVLAW